MAQESFQGTKQPSLSNLHLREDQTQRDCHQHCWELQSPAVEAQPLCPEWMLLENLVRELEDFSSRTGTILDGSMSGMPVAYVDASSFRKDHLNNHVSKSTSLALSSVVSSSWEEFNNAVGDWRQWIWASTWQWYPESLRCVRVWSNRDA